MLVVIDRFYKNDEKDEIWWLESDDVGEYVFSFDKKKDIQFVSRLSG